MMMFPTFLDKTSSWFGFLDIHQHSYDDDNNNNNNNCNDDCPS